MTVIQKHSCDSESDDSADMELNNLLDHMNEECNIELKGEQNNVLDHIQQVIINDKSKEIPNCLQNLIWKCHDLKEELTPMPIIFQGNGTQKHGVAERFGDFLGACSVCGGMTMDFSVNWQCTLIIMQCQILIKKGFLVVVCGIITYQS